jgi:hypothetical protein
VKHTPDSRLDRFLAGVCRNCPVCRRARRRPSGVASWLVGKEVREQVALADVVMPSLDAGDSDKFTFINRPHASLHFEQMIEGLIAFRHEFSGPYWLEVFLLSGYTAIAADVEKLAAWVRRIRPDRVQLNTVARPPVEEFAQGVSHQTLTNLARRFDPRAEVIAERPSRLSRKTAKWHSAAALELLRRRPCTAEDIACGLGLNRLEVLKRLEALTARGKIGSRRYDGEVYDHATAIASDRAEAAKIVRALEERSGRFAGLPRQEAAVTPRSINSRR